MKAVGKPVLFRLQFVLAVLFSFSASFTFSQHFGKTSQSTDSAGMTSDIQSLTGEMSYFIAGPISIKGNHITRPNIILRELKFKEGDTLRIADLPKTLQHAKENIFNTRLFNFVTLDTSVDPVNNLLNFSIEVIERWYIWPIPFLQVSDQNFNAWWQTRDFSRLTYGVDLTFFNVRGRNETLRIMTHFGFNQKYGFTYRIPYVNKRETIGIGFGGDMEINHQVAVKTQDNQPYYYNDPGTYPKQLTYAYAEFLYRPNIYVIHTFRLAYSHYYFQDTVLHMPGYSLTGDNNQDFVTFWYQYKNDHRDVQFYPLRGWYFDVEFSHSMPFRIAHNTYVKSLFRKYFRLQERWYYAFSFLGKISFEEQQPFYLERGLGYGREFVRGYEYYVEDGQHFGLLKNQLKFAIIPGRVEKITFIRTSKFNTIPLALYANVFVDMGYVYAYQQLAYLQNDLNIPFNSLQNAFMLGYGLGLDFTTYYDVVIRLEASLNLMGKPGIYIHFVAPI
jgi:outer membrane protein assembly factor BamA